jgi:N-acetyl-beta-hexosaminidase
MSDEKLELYPMVSYSLPIEDIKRSLDAMSWAKINHFHWHIVDAQSFPLIVPGFEELAQKGAYSASQVYTPSDVKDIFAYAAAVRVSTYLAYGHSFVNKAPLAWH